MVPRESYVVGGKKKKKKILSYALTSKKQAHPGERSKTAPQREPHVSTHVKPQDGEAKAHGGRVFDRHSGSGRGRELKKGGAGGHNWGKAGEVVTPAAAGTPEPSATGEVAVTEPVAFEPVVEEDPTLTLEEYKEKLAAKRSGAAFEVKQARKITADIKGTVYKKDEEIGEGDYIKLGKEEEKKDVVAKKTTKKTFETNFLSYEAPKPSFEGGGSRGGRGGSTRGGSPREGGAPRAPRPDGDSDAPRAPRPDAGSDAPRGGRGGAFVPRGGRGGARPVTAGARPVTAGARPVTAGARPAAVGRFDVADQDSFPKLGGAA